MCRKSARARRAAIATIAAGLVSTACTPVEPQSVRSGDAQPGARRVFVIDKLLHGDTRFDTRERQLVERACAAWSDFTAGRARVRVAWDYGEENYMDLAAVAAPHITRTPWWYAAPNTGGKVNAIGGHEVRLLPDNCPRLMPCAMHELGHVLGLAHVADVTAVMHSSLRPQTLSFTEADREECVRVRLCT
jgi:hypothetical protein